MPKPTKYANSKVEFSRWKTCILCIFVKDMGGVNEKTVNSAME